MIRLVGSIPLFTGSLAGLGIKTAQKSSLSPSAPTTPLAIFLPLLALSKDELEETALPNPGNLLQTVEVKATLLPLVKKKSEVIG